MDTNSDITQFANLLGRRLDSPEIVDFLRTWNAQPEIIRLDDYPAGSIDVHQEGFDAILAFDSIAAHDRPPRGAGHSEAWVGFMRFFAPEYCSGKQIVHYQHPIIDGVRLPLTREEVRRRFGEPPAPSRVARRLDEYEYKDCFVRFVYLRKGENVAFVELARFTCIRKGDSEEFKEENDAKPRP